MKKLILVGGVFSGIMVEDIGPEYQQQWCEQNGLKADFAFFGESLCYSDIYHKIKTKDGGEHYQFIRTNGC